MFLSLFPFPEVVSIIAICLAWIYIALGVMGTNQTAAEDIPTANPVQQQIYCVQNIDNISERTCLWYHVVELQQAEISEEHLLSYHFLSVKSSRYPIRQDHFLSSFRGNNLPSRAPPVI